jgi:hypothetical protein
MDAENDTIVNPLTRGTMTEPKLKWTWKYKPINIALKLKLT